MAEKNEDVDIDDVPTSDGETPYADTTTASDDDAALAEAGTEVDIEVPSFADESPPSDEELQGNESQTFRELRKQQAETARENRELKAKLEAASGAVKKPPELGIKPTMESCDFDPEQFEVRLNEWNDKKRAHDAAESDRQRAAQLDQEEARQRREKYINGKSALNIPDYDESEATVKGALSEVQQSLILHASEKPELLVYALGKSDKKLKELAAIKDPARFVAAFTRMESIMKTQSRKAVGVVPTQPRGNAAPKTPLRNIEKLRQRAQESGDYAEYHAALRETRKAA